MSASDALWPLVFVLEGGLVALVGIWVGSWIRRGPK